MAIHDTVVVWYETAILFHSRCDSYIQIYSVVFIIIEKNANIISPTAEQCWTSSDEEIEVKMNAEVIGL